MRKLRQSDLLSALLLPFIGGYRKDPRIKIQWSEKMRGPQKCIGSSQWHMSYWVCGLQDISGICDWPLSHWPLLKFLEMVSGARQHLNLASLQGCCLGTGLPALALFCIIAWAGTWLHSRGQHGHRDKQLAAPGLLCYCVDCLLSHAELNCSHSPCLPCQIPLDTFPEIRCQWILSPRTGSFKMSWWSALGSLLSS